MNYRVVWLSGMVLGAAGTAGACDAPDPGEVTFSERSKTESSTSSGGGGSSGAASSSGTPAGDGGGSSGDSGPAGDPVFGTTTYKGTAPGQNANGAAPDHAGTVEGKNCLQAGTCHGGTTNPFKWGFAGTVYSTMNGGATVKNAEVAVTDPTGKMTLVTADDNGNFWYEGAKPVAGSRAGARTAKTVMKMSSNIDAAGSASGCASDNCHGLGTQKLYVTP